MTFRIFVLLSVLTVTSATVWPSHVAATVGGNATLTCNPTSSGTGGQWQFKPYASSTLLTTVYRSSSPSNHLTQDYEASPDNPHDLHIISLQETTAGDYLCSLDDQDEAHVASTMLLKDLTCSIHQTSGDSPSSPITFECRVAAYGHVDPSMEWIRGGQVQSGDQFRVDEPVETWQWRTIQLDYETTATTEYDNEVHTCRIFWAQNGENNMPTYETECTEVYRVRHAPTNMQIHHEGQMVTPSQPFTAVTGDNVTCSVSAYPEAVMRWEHVGGNGPADPETSSSSENTLELIITDDMIGDMSQYNCIAEGNGEEVMETITFSVVGSDESLSSGSIVQFSISVTAALVTLAFLG